mgnify:CR=1 FL=1
MKRKKIVITLLTILTVMALMISKSFAAGSYSASLTPNNSKVTKGSEVKVTLKLSGISVDGGINGVVGTLKFDTDILTLSKSEGLDDWTVTYNEDNKKLVIDSAEAITTDKDIATFTFKVKENTSATNAAIQLVSISAANSTLDDPVKISDISTNIGIGASISGNTNNNNNNNNNNNTTSNDTQNETNNNTNNSPRNQTNNSTSRNSISNSNSSVSNNVQKVSNSSTVNNENMPYTGASDYIVPLMLAVLTLAIVSFVNYKKIEK